MLLLIKKLSLIRLYFNVDEDQLVIRKYEKKQVKKYINKNKSHLKNSRITIALSKISNPILPDIFSLKQENFLRSIK
jgi:hypothetical protein